MTAMTSSVSAVPYTQVDGAGTAASTAPSNALPCIGLPAFS
jgi:hypothetical protein